LPSPDLPRCGSDSGRHKATLAVPNTSITPSACARRRRPPSNPPFLRKGIQQRSDALASTCACRRPSPALAAAVDLHLSRRREDIQGLSGGERKARGVRLGCGVHEPWTGRVCGLDLGTGRVVGPKQYPSGIKSRFMTWLLW
jgi:hypothetical protein